MSLKVDWSNLWTVCKPYVKALLQAAIGALAGGAIGGCSVYLPRLG